MSVAADELWASVLPKEIPKIANATIMNTQNRNLIMKSVSLIRWTRLLIAKMSRHIQSSLVNCPRDITLPGSRQFMVYF